MHLKIRAALSAEGDVLNRIAIESKAHWGYSQQQITAWASDLITPPETIATWPTCVAESEGIIIGFTQADPTTEPWELISLWVKPAHMGQGVGRRLLDQILAIAATSGQGKISIDADPNALGFYLKCGAKQIGAVSAPIAGDPSRVRPQLELLTQGNDTHTDLNAS